MSFCNFLLASVLHVGRFYKPYGLRGGLARPPVIHVLKFSIYAFRYLKCQL
jgi:hypothetical protein